jgi:hypothetical protein
MRERRLGRPKSTKKLFLTDIQRAQRYKLALSRKDWGLREWRKVVFSDEASILVGEQRGFQRISRTLEERFHPNVIEVRYNNYLEAMFWGCFSYDHKGPCHVYLKEDPSKTADWDQIINEKNAEIELKLRVEFAEQEAKKKAKWAALRRKPLGRPATWEVF